MTFNPIATGRKIRKLRDAARMNQYDLAAELNVSHSYISKIEIGKRIGGIDIYVAIANTFGVTLDYLLGEDEEDKPKEAAMMRVRIAMSLLKDVEKLLSKIKKLLTNEFESDIVNRLSLETNSNKTKNIDN